MSRIWADGVDCDKRTNRAAGRQSLSMSREAVPNLNQSSRVGTELRREGGLPSWWGQKGRPP